MLNLLYFILCSYGLTFILVYGSIFDRIRPKKESGKIGELLSCPLCTGFWSGVFLTVVSPHTSLFTFEVSFVNMFLMGCLSAGTSYILSSLFGDGGIQVENH
jgi:hypothetical protein